MVWRWVLTRVALVPMSLALSFAAPAFAAGDAALSEATRREIVWKFERSLEPLPLPERVRKAREFFASLTDPEMRVEAIGMLCSRYVYVVPNSVYNEILAPLLRDPAPKVRERAAVAVGYNGLGSAHAEALLDLLKSNDLKLEEKGSVFYAIGHSRDRRFTGTLRSYLTHVDSRLRISAANALWQLEPDAKELPTLLADPAPTVRAALVQLIPRAAEARRLVADSSALVRERAARAMGDSRDPRLAARVVRLLRDPEASVRSQAAYGLGRLKATQYGDRIEALLTQDEDLVVRRYAAMALAEIRSERHLAGLRTAQKDVDPQVREYATRAIRLIEDPTLNPDTLR